MTRYPSESARDFATELKNAQQKYAQEPAKQPAQPAPTAVQPVVNAQAEVRRKLGWGLV